MIEPAPRRVVYLGAEVGYRTAAALLEQRYRVAIDGDPGAAFPGQPPRGIPHHPSQRLATDPSGRTCQRHRSLIRARGHGAGPRTLTRELVSLDEAAAPLRQIRGLRAYLPLAQP